MGCTIGYVAVTALLHGKESSVIGDNAYSGAGKRAELSGWKLTFFIAAKRTRIMAIGTARARRHVERWESYKASRDIKVDNPFRVIKRQFG